jgi:hypothetical protein
MPYFSFFQASEAMVRKKKSQEKGPGQNCQKSKMDKLSRAELLKTTIVVRVVRTRGGQKEAVSQWR